LAEKNNIVFYKKERVMKMHVSIRWIIVILPVFILGTSMAIADVPHAMNYQGRLTDAAGLAVPDDKYDISFTIWSDSTSTDPSEVLWTSGYQSVIVENGLFTYMLGSNTPLPDYFFRERANIFLGITLSGGSEMTPRQRITASGYAFHALRADSAKHVSGDQFLLAGGDTLTGDLTFRGGTTDIGGLIDVGSDYADLHLNDNGSGTAHLYGQVYGSLYLHDSDGDQTAVLDARNSSGGILKLRTNTALLAIELDAGLTGDNSVLLPSNAIHSSEILNEAGIAHNNDLYWAGDTLIYDDFNDLTTVSITIPGPGYIYVMGRCHIQMGGVSGWNGAILQIDKNAGGSTSEYYTFIYSDLAITYYKNANVFVDRLYHETSAGTYTFRLEGKKHLNTGTAIAHNSMLTALYFPTSYGAVKSIVTDPGDNPEAIPVTSRDENGNMLSGYEVDLRYYEMQAQSARLKAIEAELELERARQQAADREREK
jgi:hypothetical protein